MKHFVLAGLSAMSVSSYAQETVNDTLFYTGSEQTWTVPCGATNIVIDAFGARGAAGSTINPTINSGGAAGLGNRVTGNWSVLEASDVLYIYVGGKANGSVGGFNGGGNGVAIQNDYPSGGGGGATDIRFPSNALADRIQVAGGGGGGGNAGSHGLSGTFSGGNGGNGGGNQQLYGNSLAGADGEAASETPHVSPGALGGTTGTPGLAAEGCSGFLGPMAVPIPTKLVELAARELVLLACYLPVEVAVAVAIKAELAEVVALQVPLHAPEMPSVRAEVDQRVQTTLMVLLPTSRTESITATDTL